MKTKNMRKKALVSSIAMLLVAVVALGGATFAWFSANTQATASGVSLATSAESSLLFAAKNTAATADTWTTSWSLNGYDSETGDPIPSSQVTATVLSPCSSSDGYSFVTVGTTAPSDSTQEYTKVSSFTTAGYVETKEFAVKSTTDAPCYVTGLSISATQPDAQYSALIPALRVSVKVGESGQPKVFALQAISGTKYVLKEDTGYTAGDTPLTYYDLYNIGDTDHGNGASGTYRNVRYDQASIVSVNTQAAQVASLEANTPLNVTVKIWLEGNDSNCNNNLMGRAIRDFSISMATSLS